MQNKVRRVITGFDENGASTIVNDEYASYTSPSTYMPGLVSHELWIMESSQCNLPGSFITANKQQSIEPPDFASAFRVVDFPPDSTYLPKLDIHSARELYKEMGAEHVFTAHEHSPHPLMHKTQTIDYGIVLSGEIYLVLEAKEVKLHPGDVIIQRSTSHAWSNRSTNLCRMAFILFSTRPEKGKI